jgi:hypothetical protein
VRTSWLVGLIACSIIAIARTPAARADDGSLEWFTLESDHFVVHYYAPNEDLARRVAVVAERAHRTLTKALGHTPSGKTDIIITDDTDGANGFAAVIPRNRIHLYATAPGSLSTLNDHDDWLYGLVAHEYSHIVHLDTIGGIPRLYNLIFGKTWAPNQIQPRWFIEGLATYEESKRSSGGRTRSAIFDMYLRTQVLAGKPLDIAQVSSGTYEWPHGNTAYLYGAHFLKYIADRWGDDKLAKISREYGRQPIPFGLNKAIARVVGRDYVEIYEDWTEHMRRKYGLQRDAVLARGLLEGRKLTDTGETNGTPRYSVDGREIWWIRSDGWSRPRYRGMPVGGTARSPAARDVAVIEDAGQYAILPDGSGVVLERSMNYRTFYGFGDLFTYAFESKTLTRRTWGARISDPDVSPDGKWAAFSVNGRSRSRIGVLSLDDGSRTPTILWEGEGRFDQGYSPSFSPDGKRIAFSAWTTGGYHDIYVIDRDGGEAIRLTNDRAIDVSPRWSPDGKHIYFSSDRTGIYNIYRIDLATRKLDQITNVLGGAFQPDVSRDGKRLVYRGFDDDGFEIYELLLDERAVLEPEVYIDDRPPPVAIPDDEVPVSPPRPYRPIESLAPNRYELDWATGTFGTEITVATSGADIIGRHGWSIGASYGIDRGDVEFGMGYSYSRFWPTLRFGAGRSVADVGGLVIDGRSTRYERDTWQASASVSLPVLRRPETSSDLSFGYDVDWDRNVDGELPTDPNQIVPRPPETGVLAGIAMRWSMSNAKRFTYTLGPTEGRTLSASLRFNHPSLGSDFESLLLEYRWQEWWGLPWWNHVVSFRLAGGVEQTDRRGDGRFSLGGTGDQDVVTAIVDSLRVGTAVLHGYEPGSLRGRQYFLINTEYRVPIHVIEEGVATLPAYFRRVHLALLFDAGFADDDFSFDEIRYSIGGSIRLDVTFGYYEPGTFDLGISRGLSEGGVTEWWFLLTQTI